MSPGGTARSFSTSFASNPSAMASATYTRSIAQHVWPELRNAPHSTPELATSRSASSRTIAASCPPSSITTGVRCFAAASAMRRPVPGEPMKQSLSTGASTSAAPTSPAPWTTVHTPGGSASRTSRSRSPTPGVASLGLMTTAFPASSAGAIAMNDRKNG